MIETESIRLLRELVDLTRVLVMPTARELLQHEFFEDNSVRLDRARVYARLDGRRNQRQIAEESGVNQSTVSRWSGEWKRKGLVNPEGAAVFDLTDHFPDATRGING